MTGLYNVVPELFGRTDNYNTYAPDYGKQYSIYNGLELSVSARLRNGLQFQAGSSTGETVTDNCEIRAKLPEIGIPNTGAQNSFASCHNSPGVTTRVTGASSYTVPKIDVLVSGTFQSSPGATLAVNYNVPFSVVQQIIGRPVSGTGNNLSINLLAPDQMRGERVNQIDLRMGKLLRFGQQRANIAVDVFNLLNPDTILGYNQTFVQSVTSGTQAWLRPTQVMTARTTKLTRSGTSDSQHRLARKGYPEMGSLRLELSRHVSPDPQA